MLSITKRFQDIPFAHRQPKHDGHCRFIHGHNWTFDVTFTASKLDENGFVIDFGKLGCIKDWVKDNLDHACVLNWDDPFLKNFPMDEYFKVLAVPDCSCEGLAQFLLSRFHVLVAQETLGRVFVSKVVVFEDSKNSAEFSV